jgi:NAD(P)-dependent dehydrogenase (short-subunit alcohol dehydrogenase family)
MKDRIVLITGSTDGIGKQTALDLAQKGATLLVHGRDLTRGKVTVNEIKHQSNNSNIDLFISDFSSLQQVKKLAEEIKAMYNRLDVLINNAGVYMKKHVLTEDRYEMTFQVNHLAHFLLTILLLDLIDQGAPSRIVNVSSMAHSSSIDFNDLQSEKSYSAYGAYTLSKLANILFTFKLAYDLKNTDVTVNCLHPGVINTKLLRGGFGAMGSDVKAGAKIPVFLASSTQLEGISGKFYAGRISGLGQKEQRTAEIAYNRNVQEKLWTISEEMVGINS